MELNTTSSLDQSILDLVEMSPVEDLLLALLPPWLPGVDVRSLVQDDQTFPLALCRRVADWGDWQGDERFQDAATIAVHTYCEGVNADSDAALLSEAIRVVLRKSINVPIPDQGHITKIKMLQAPHRVTDWATASGPVQYADLPTGVHRYETTYRIDIKRAFVNGDATPR